jgi:signal transduction histidine kinase
VIRAKNLDLQAKVSLVLLGVIIPTFVVVTIAENAITRPLLENEMKQVGVSTGQALAEEIEDSRWLQSEQASAVIASRMKEVLDAQRNIALLRVYVPTGKPLAPPALLVSSDGTKDETASSPSEDLSTPTEEDALQAALQSPLHFARLHDHLEATIVQDDDGDRIWKLIVPIVGRNKRVIGNVLVVVSLKLVDRIQALLWRSTVIAALVAFASLFIGLRYFLRRTIENERRLIAAEDQNVQLTEQLHETQRQLMNTEKLAVMGQLTATFAHEIGTPLNAMSGHLQLLGGELSESRPRERLSIIRGQVEKIEKIVRGFLQSTAQPASQRQLVDLNRLIDQTLTIVGPRADSIGIEIEKNLAPAMGPVRAVPLELEQIFLNLVTNSLDSLREKNKSGSPQPLRLVLSSRQEKYEGRSFAVVEIRDTGEGIAESELKNVWKPFYTTKRPGEGTGLGLTISQQLAKQNGGVIEMLSEQGSWTQATLKLPYV